jgi:hypothetical protein
MGVDLYINSLPDEKRRGAFEVSEEAVRSGYFRTSYGGLFSIMSATLGETISWWFLRDRLEWFDDEHSDMTPEGCKAFWAEMRPKVLVFLAKKEYFTNEYLGEAADGPTRVPMTDPDQIAFAKEHAELFMKFYRYAIELGSSVHWSV